MFNTFFLNLLLNSFLPNLLLVILGGKPTFNFQCLRPQSSVDELPIPGNYRGNTSPTRSRLQVKPTRAPAMFTQPPGLNGDVPHCQMQHSLDSRPSSVSSSSSVSWANNVAAGNTPGPGSIAPLGRRGKLIYTPMILVDETTGISQSLWSDGSASLPAGSRPGWYSGQSGTYGSLRVF